MSYIEIVHMVDGFELQQIGVLDINAIGVQEQVNRCHCLDLFIVMIKVVYFVLIAGMFMSNNVFIIVAHAIDYDEVMFAKMSQQLVTGILALANVFIAMLIFVFRIHNDIFMRYRLLCLYILFTSTVVHAVLFVISVMLSMSNSLCALSIAITFTVTVSLVMICYLYDNLIYAYGLPLREIFQFLPLLPAVHNRYFNAV